MVGCGDQKQAQQAASAPPAAVGVVTLQPRPVAKGYEFIGRIQAITRVDLLARVEGFLEALHFREGQEVKKGDLLFSIEKDMFKAQVDQFAAQVAAAQANLANAAATQKLVNVSGRAAIGTGDNVGIAGFVISGTVPKRVLIRGVGPSLAGQGVGTPLAHPVILLYKSRAVIAQNAGVHTATEATAIAAATTQVGAFALTGSSDATLLLSLDPGAYTVVLADSSGGTGVGLVEVYEVP